MMYRVINAIILISIMMSCTQNSGTVPLESATLSEFDIKYKFYWYFLDRADTISNEHRDTIFVHTAYKNGIFKFDAGKDSLCLIDDARCHMVINGGIVRAYTKENYSIYHFDGMPETRFDSSYKYASVVVDTTYSELWYDMNDKSVSFIMLYVVPNPKYTGSLIRENFYGKWWLNKDCKSCEYNDIIEYID